MSGVGGFFQGVAQGLPGGVQLGLQARNLRDNRAADEQRIGLAREQMDISKEELGLRREDIAIKRTQMQNELKDRLILNQLAGGIQADAQQTEALTGILDTGSQLASTDKAMRGPLVDQFAGEFKANFGKDLSPVVVQTLKKLPSEQLGPLWGQLVEQTNANPDANIEELVMGLSDPAASARTLMELNQGARQAQDQTIAGRGEQRVMSAQKARMEAERARLARKLENAQRAASMVSTEEGSKRAFAMIDSIEKSIQNIDGRLMQDFTETLDLGDRIEIRDKTSGEVIETRMKNAAPSTASQRLINVMDPATKAVSAARFSNNGERTFMDGRPVPPNFINQGIGSGDEQVVEVTDNGVVFRTGGPGSSTVSTTSKLEQQNDQLNQAILQAGELRDSLRQKDLGASGVFIENVLNQAVGQVYPSVAQQDVTANRNQLRALREGALKAVTTDDRFSNSDRQAITKLFPNDGVFQSLPDAQARLDTLIDVFSDREAYSAGRLKRKPLTEMTPADIQSAVKSGDVDLRTGMRTMKMFHPDYLKAWGKKNGG